MDFMAMNQGQNSAGKNVMMVYLGLNIIGWVILTFVFIYLAIRNAKGMLSRIVDLLMVIFLLPFYIMKYIHKCQKSLFSPA